MILGGAVFLCLAAYERWFRADESTVPHVSLEMPTSGTFILRNHGRRADKVTISDITVENHYCVSFPPTFDLRDQVEVVPNVRAVGWTAALSGDDKRTGSPILVFLDRMARDKVMYIQEIRSDGRHWDSGTTDELVQGGMTPLRYPLVVTVQSGAQSWTHRELLLYDSSRRVAWVEHTVASR